MSRSGSAGVSASPEPIPPPKASGFTTTTAVPLYWCSYGPENAERLLVLHGGPGAHHDYLLPQLLHLAERYELIFYDQRGGGRSRVDSSERVTWETNVADLASVLREFSIAKPSLVGYSWGGMLAILYTLESMRGGELAAPARLALIDPAPLSKQYRREFEQEFARRENGLEIRKMRETLAESGLRQSDPDAYRQRTFELAVAAYFADPTKARGLTPFRVSGRVQQSVWESLGAEYNVLARLTPPDCPTLFVHGREDPIPMASSEAGAQAMNAELVLLDDCGHVPYVEQFGRLFAALDEFLTASDSRTRD
ncbi:MAG: alpha/beta hydrolase [Gemmatimonadota bacterium]|nr:alpha/beta hydrolase [Gemmatimonadota bacterium]